VIIADASAPYTSTPDNSEDQAKGALHALVEEVIKYAHGRGQHIDHHRHQWLYSDTEYDEQFIQLNAFAEALHHIEALSEAHQSYGVDAAQHMVLQFLYAYLMTYPTSLSMSSVLSLSGRVFVVSCPSQNGDISASLSSRISEVSWAGSR
jgi:hypothetical protein